MRKTCLGIVCLVLLVCLSVIHTPASYAVVLDPVLDRHLVRDSDFVFLGTVKAIEYKMSSTQDKEERPIPHTFVTFAIERILKGTTADPRSITLRFQGGRGEKSQYLEVGGIPLFDLEDRGVFYVRNNGNHVCPLVGWKNGWGRILDNQIFSDAGDELLLSDDPVLAGRIHPRDIRNYAALFVLLQKPERMVDRMIWEALQPETRLLIQNPDNVREIDPDALQFLFPERQLAGEKIEADFLEKLMPTSFRTVPRQLAQTLFYRDLNLLLLRRNFFTPNNTGDLELRSETKERLFRNQSDLPLEEILLLNRRVLEDAYPTILTKSLDQTVARGQWVPLEEAMTHQVSETLNTMVMSDPKGEGGEPGREPVVEGVRLNAEEYVAFVQTMIEALHTPEELKQLPPAISANAKEPFFINPLRPIQAQLDLSAPPRVPTDDEGKMELNEFLRSGGNPVLKR